MITAIIPARQGSKGLPGKNLREFHGQTLLARAIGTAQEAGSRVIVSTDGAEIAAEAARCGAEVLMRPADLATDTATTWAVVRHVLAEAEVSRSDPVAIVQCTNPFCTPGDVQRCAIAETGADLAVCVQATHDLLLDEDGSPINWGFDQTQRQARGAQYRLTGSVWAFSAAYCQQRELYEGWITPVVAELPIQRDIDTLQDLEEAAALWPLVQPCLKP